MSITKANLVLCVLVSLTCGQSDAAYLTPVVLQQEDGATGSCPSEELMQVALYNITRDVSEVLRTVFRTPCGGSGWRRIAFLNMSDDSMQCPQGLFQTAYSKRTCGVNRGRGSGCDSTIFRNDGGGEYSQVCGRMIGYQYGEPEAFTYGGDSVESLYMDGASVTHGPPGSRVHIWSFVAGMGTTFDIGQGRLCPCDTTVPLDTVPSFLSEADYFCSSGNHERNVFRQNTLYPDDPLWDGVGCEPHSICCTQNNPPYFNKQLPNPTTDDIEVRLCVHQRSIDDLPIELIELYVM